MAGFDTANKRRSALNFNSFCNILPLADGEVGLDDRAIRQCRYAFDTFPSGEPWSFLPVTSANWSEDENVSSNWNDTEDVSDDWSDMVDK
jgi:hypothetical protein